MRQKVEREIKTDSQQYFVTAIVHSFRETQADLRYVFSSSVLRLLFFLTFTIRTITLAIILPNTPSPFAPDEGTYARLAEFVSRGQTVQEFPEFGPVLYNQSKSLIGPSSLLIRLGVDSLDSVRIVASIYGYLTPIFTLLCFTAVLRSKNHLKKLDTFFQPFINKFLLSILIFLPSNFLWSTLGLRESASQFWILAQTYFLIKFYSEVKYTKLIFALLSTITSVYSYSSRPQTALLISIILVILGVISALKKRGVSLLLVSIFCVLSGNAFASTPKVELIQKWTLIEVTDSPSEKNSKTGGSKVTDNSNTGNTLCSSPNQRFQISHVVYKCVEVKEYKKSLLPPINSLPQNIDISKLGERRNLNRVDASSALAPSYCSQSMTEITKIKCNLSELPYRLTAVLLRPFPFFDEGSSFLLFAGLENLVWLLLFLVTLINLAKMNMRSLFKEYVVSITLFLILFSTAVSLYEGNMGTAFRHKSTLIGHLILINFVSIASYNIRSSGFEYKKTK